MDSEWSEGIFLGMTGQTSEIMIGTENGICTTSDVRRLPDGPGRWNVKMIKNMKITFEEYIDPSSTDPDGIVVKVPESLIDPSVIPAEPALTQHVRRMRLAPEDFQKFGYTGGCQGCIHLQRNSPSRRNHSEACRKRIEAEVTKTAEGRARKEKESQRREDELTKELEKEDERIKAESEAINKANDCRRSNLIDAEFVDLEDRSVKATTPRSTIENELDVEMSGSEAELEDRPNHESE